MFRHLSIVGVTLALPFAGLFPASPKASLNREKDIESRPIMSQAEAPPHNGIARGKPAPDFEARALDGKLVKLADLRGKVVMLDFMASWCGICLTTLPEVKEICGKFERSKFEIISVSLDGGETTDTTLRDLKDFLARSPVSWPVIFDDTGWDNAIARSYGVNRLPIHVIIDREGIIRLISEGGGKDKMGEIRSVLRRLM